MKYGYNTYLKRYFRVVSFEKDTGYVIIICYKRSERAEHLIRAEIDNCRFFATKGEMINSIELRKSYIDTVLKNAKADRH